jgi:hypothetical protein
MRFKIVRFFAGVPILAPSTEFLLSHYDKSNLSSIWHHTSNNVGCTEEAVHLEPCCAEHSCIMNISLSSHLHSSCSLLRASLFSPDVCSRDSLVEWLPRIHTAIFPHVQQFDTVDELFELMHALQFNVEPNLLIREGMRRWTLEIMTHNAGEISPMLPLLQSLMNRIFIIFRRCKALHGFCSKRFRQFLTHAAIASAAACVCEDPFYQGTIAHADISLYTARAH